MSFLKIAGRNARSKRIISEANKREADTPNKKKSPLRRSVGNGEFAVGDHTPYACSSVTTQEMNGGEGNRRSRI